MLCIICITDAIKSTVQYFGRDFLPRDFFMNRTQLFRALIYCTQFWKNSIEWSGTSCSFIECQGHTVYFFGCTVSFLAIQHFLVTQYSILFWSYCFFFRHTVLIFYWSYSIFFWSFSIFLWLYSIFFWSCSIYSIFYHAVYFFDHAVSFLIMQYLVLAIQFLLGVLFLL